ncbi:MAG: hypothetical protein QME55_00195 [Brevundimonas sp.]|uniref:hypothetical protein n=1 Tax=Brevundimonas sp. TaxID=1871086 RepID=UPI0026361F6A|nr:hypothetical protein [Brevundimonas sp.]MDI6623122.1 hypothetical protein [Brevundimonas sp.]
MIVNRRHLGLSLLYVTALSWIYLTEIVPHWSYMGFKGTFSFAGLAMCIAMTTITAVFVPRSRDTRMAVLASMHYLFILPTAVYLSYSSPQLDRYFSFGILWVGFTFFSALQMKSLSITPLSIKYILFIVFGAIIGAVGIQAAFGGLQYFNLDIERVYEFRREAASSLPMIFGYLYSNVASVLVPLALVLSIRFRAYWLVALALGCTVLLFGMTHHKSVLFGPPAAALLYVFFSRMKKPEMIGIFFMAIPIVCIAELLYLRVFIDMDTAGYINSLLARRMLFVPAMLDTLYIDYFSLHEKYYWSSSRLGSWAGENPHGVAAPFLIGSEYFSDNDMSANAGVIGGGYANAGLLGVAIYSIISGLLVAMLNAFGRRAGHALVTAVSLATVFNILTTTDLVTAFLTHGLLLLVLVLALFPDPVGRRPMAAGAAA